MNDARFLFWLPTFIDYYDNFEFRNSKLCCHNSLAVNKIDLKMYWNDENNFRSIHIYESMNIDCVSCVFVCVWVCSLRPRLVQFMCDCHYVLIELTYLKAKKKETKEFTTFEWWDSSWIWYLNCRFVQHISEIYCRFFPFISSSLNRISCVKIDLQYLNGIHRCYCAF